MKKILRLVSMVVTHLKYRKFHRKYDPVLNKPLQPKISLEGAPVAPNPKRVWICWLQGYEAASSLVKACINSFKVNLPDFEMIFLDAKNIAEYIDLPKYIWEKYRKGIITHAHFSDLVRTELLCRYGGLWADATVLCTAKNLGGGEFSSVLDTDFFAFKSYGLGGPPVRGPVATGGVSNWFLYSKLPANPILMKVRELLFFYWEDETSLFDYFFWHEFFRMTTTKFKEEYDKIPNIVNLSAFMIQYELEFKFSEKRWAELLRMSDFHKLNHHVNYNERLSSAEEKRVFHHILELYGVE